MQHWREKVLVLAMALGAFVMLSCGDVDGPAPDVEADATYVSDVADDGGSEVADDGECVPAWSCAELGCGTFDSKCGVMVCDAAAECEGWP